MVSLHTPIPPGSLWSTSNWSKLLKPLNNPYYQNFTQWSSHNARSLNLHTLAFRLGASTPHVVEFSLRLEHLVRGSYQPYGDDQYAAFIGEEHNGVPSYDCHAGSADRRWHRTRLSCVAPTNVHVMLCLRRATSNLKITAVVRGSDTGMEESVSVVVGVRGGSTVTANASRKRKQADGINTLPLEHTSKLAALTEIGDALFDGDTAALAALPLPLPLTLSTAPASPTAFMLAPPPPASAVPDLSQCCCAAPPTTSAGDSTGSAPACCDPNSSDMQCCATTTGAVDPATCAELCTLRMLPALGDDLGVLDWAM